MELTKQLAMNIVEQSFNSKSSAMVILDSDIENSRAGYVQVKGRTPEILALLVGLAVTMLEGKSSELQTEVLTTIVDELAKSNEKEGN